MDRRHALALFALTAVVACAAPRRDDTFVVACDFDNPPFAFVAADGTLAGRDVEMMERIAQEVGLTLEWRKLPFDELLDAVAGDEVDAACATLGITEERERVVAFSMPYYETRIACLVRKGTGEPTTLADLDGMKVAAGRGTTSEAALTSVLPRAIAVVTAKAPKPTRERLRLKEIDAAVMDGPDADDLAAAHPETFRVIDKPLAVERYAIALTRTNGALKEEVDAAIERLRTKGWLDALDGRWGL
ncbi:MAG: amino acid ABC transporter substrate-binding protein [Planctomycetes bacterium]|nr:amino acid ABC transporter substrate-binding protein [Planctomycetota bacterium]MCC7170551.1 amino acid ABC transporter substrate-binding protein [Planctomycetota bacterium]